MPRCAVLKCRGEDSIRYELSGGKCYSVLLGGGVTSIIGGVKGVSNRRKWVFYGTISLAARRSGANRIAGDSHIITVRR